MLISSLVVKLAQRCNLNCTYCYMYNHADQTYRNRPAFMSSEVFDAMIENVAKTQEETGKPMSLVFHGGEPMLFNPRTLGQWLTRATARLGGKVGYGIQTNATLVTDEWLSILHNYSIRPGVSLDGSRESHDRNRLTHTGDGSFDKVIEGLTRLVDSGLDPGVLCVIEPGSSGEDTYAYFRSLGIKRMDFLIPDTSRDNRHLLYPGPRKTPVADFLISGFNRWFREDDPDVTVRIFVEAIRVLQGAKSRTDAFQGSTQNYLIIDTDGSILANDALKVAFHGAPVSGLNVRTHRFEDIVVGENRGLLAQILENQMPHADQCTRCTEYRACGGGALPHRYSSANGFRNPSAWCEDLLAFLSHVRSVISPYLAEKKTLALSSV